MKKKIAEMESNCEEAAKTKLLMQTVKNENLKFATELNKKKEEIAGLLIQVKQCGSAKIDDTENVN